MYPVTQDFLNKIKENMRTVKTEIKTNHSQGELILTDKDLALGSLIYTESSQAGEEFTIGSTVASDISFTILNKPEYDDINFMGATVTCNIGLLVEEGVDAHFMQPSQPSKMPGFEEKWEYVPLGRFNIDHDPRQRNTIELKAIDNMIKLDIPYSLSKLSYPATLYQIYVNICNVGDILVGTTSFPNMNYVVGTRPDGDLTLRDVLGYVAELAGCFARCNRNGALELTWYKSTGLEIGPANRFNFKPSDDQVRIKGIMATVGEIVYLAGSDDYAIDLTENPLLQGGHETVLRNIFNNVKDTVFTPYTSNWQGNMTIQAGDMITQIDKDGKTYNTLVTKSTYKYRGKSTLEAKGLPDISKGYKGSTDRKIAQIKRKIDIEVGDKLTNLEQAIVNATELLTSALGGYVVKREGELLIMDTENVDTATKIWRWNLNGLGYSENGIKGPYEVAITMDGSINAKFITTGSLSALMVQTGILQSEDGSSWINLDNGFANFRNQVVIDGSGVTLTIGDDSKFGPGNYMSLHPDSPLNAYRDHKTQIDMWTSNLGGYLLLNRPDGNTAFRAQGLGNSANGCQIHLGDLSEGSTGEIWSRNFNFIGIGSYSEFLVNTKYSYFNGDLSCGGEKNAIVKTDHYGYRKLYSEESDRVYFSTRGVVQTKNLKYIIRLDEIFLETIEPNSQEEYIIQLTPYAQTSIWVKAVYDKYIIIESTLDCKFSYEVRGIRKGYGNRYLDEVDLDSIRSTKMGGPLNVL